MMSASIRVSKVSVIARCNFCAPQVLKTIERQDYRLVTDWKQRNQPHINAGEAADCSKTVVAGEVAEWLMAPVLKTGIPETVSGVQIPPSPP